MSVRLHRLGLQAKCHGATYGRMSGPAWELSSGGTLEFAFVPREGLGEDSARAHAGPADGDAREVTVSRSPRGTTAATSLQAYLRIVAGSTIVTGARSWLRTGFSIRDRSPVTTTMILLVWR